MRNWILLSVMGVEIFLIVFCLVKKSNHVPAGFICAAVAFVLLIVTGWLLLFPKVPTIATSGRYGVGYAQTWYADETRPDPYAGDGSFRELNVAVWYPENCEEASQCPLVIFSHGSFGVKESNLTLYRELASRGYVVIAPDHTYQCFSTKLSGGKKVRMSGSFMKEIMTDNANKNPEKSYERMRKWMDVRTKDLNFVLDIVLDQAAQGSERFPFYKLIDPSKIVAMGHSLGGSAALGLGRQRNDISAVVSLEAPFMCDMQGVADGKFIFDESEYPVPMLNVYSDSSYKHLREWKQYAQNARYLDREDAKYQSVHLEGIGHMSLTDFSLTSPFLTMCIDGKIAKHSPEKTLAKLNDVCLSFLEQSL